MGSNGENCKLINIKNDNIIDIPNRLTGNAKIYKDNIIYRERMVTNPFGISMLNINSKETHLLLNLNNGKVSNMSIFKSFLLISHVNPPEMKEDQMIDQLVIVDLDTRKIIQQIDNVFCYIGVNDKLVIFSKSCVKTYNVGTFTDETTKHLQILDHDIIRVEYESGYYICQLSNDTLAILNDNFELLKILENVGGLILS